MLLSDLKLGSSSNINKINLKSDMCMRLYDLGLIEGTLVKLILVSNGIKAYLIRGSLIAIRDKDAKEIVVGEIYD